MTMHFTSIRRIHFETRMFASLLIVAVVCLFFAARDVTRDPLMQAVGQLTRLDHSNVLTIAYLVSAALMLVATLLRMWAGSQLTSDRVMAFPVQTDRLMTSGPYHLVRNPIYLADLIAVAGAGLPLGLPGLLLPLLFFIHYSLLIRYEERFLKQRHGRAFDDFTRRVPRIIPSLRSVRGLMQASREFSFTRDGIRHNATYVMYILGCVAASRSHVFWHAAVIGLPTLLDWAFIHTKKGTFNFHRAQPLHLGEEHHA